MQPSNFSDWSAGSGMPVTEQLLRTCRLLPEHSSQAKLQAELLGTGPEPSGFELSPATPPSVKGRTLPVTTPQSKPRALHFATPAAAITAAAVASGEPCTIALMLKVRHRGASLAPPLPTATSPAASAAPCP